MSTLFRQMLSLHGESRWLYGPMHGLHEANPVGRFSGLAGDYAALAQEVLDAITQRQLTQQNSPVKVEVAV